jgi:putative acetyltransferase
MQIRPYRADDLPELVEIFTTTVRMLGREHYNDAQLAAWAPEPPDLDDWADRLKALHTLVMEDAGCPLGFISWHQDSDKSGYINLIFVRPDSVRNGVASRLLAAAEAALEGVERLHVHASLIARPFFERRGYKIAHEQTVTRAGVELRRYEMYKG